MKSLRSEESVCAARKASAQRGKRLRSEESVCAVRKEDDRRGRPSRLGSLRWGKKGTTLTCGCRLYPSGQDPLTPIPTRGITFAGLSPKATASGIAPRAGLQIVGLHSDSVELQPPNESGFSPERRFVTGICDRGCTKQATNAPTGIPAGSFPQHNKPNSNETKHN